VYATDSRDVRNVVKCATKLDYIVNALSEGHSYEAYGLGSTYNNIIINMEAINYININPNDQTGTFGAGTRLGPIYYKSYQYDQYTVNADVCPWVGLAGHALGGGDGFLPRLHGLLLDNVLELKAINAHGKMSISSF
jgi:FAD/FMN-containing dehydrogenase